MSVDHTLIHERFLRSNNYHSEWVVASASGGAHSLWLTEWLTTEMDLRPGMRVLDLGCGRASSSIFLHREFGVEVWATDLWSVPLRTSSESETPRCKAMSSRSKRLDPVHGRKGGVMLRFLVETQSFTSPRASNGVSFFAE